jgi:DNA polymerase elongation subunit (family B)
MLSAVSFLNKKDPDIIYTKQGDSKIFPILCHHAKKQGILSSLQFGRDPSCFLHPLKEETSYMSYGRILHRPGFYMFKGRAHIDLAHSFFHMDGGMYGLIDLSRCANIPFQLLSRLGPGTAISQIQVNNAIAQGYLIPYKKTMPEMWKSAADLLTSDRGGLIFEPEVGLHERVIELDFASLYPNIMVKYNISPETLFCSCCAPSNQKVPQLGYPICTKKTGLLPRVLQPILQRRFLFKARSKNARYDIKRYEQLQKTWKWVLIVCFGYTGYRNARYGRIECHESITAYSRDLLLKATAVVENEGYQVLHGIVDSLWIHPKKPHVKPVHLARMISQKTGVHMELKGQYRWIVFLPCKATGVGALNRYYGLFDSGVLKMRGIELRQHNTPIFFKEVQKRILEVFGHATTREDFRKLIPSALHVLCDAAHTLWDGRVDPLDLVFTTRISKPLDTYKVNTFTVAALKQLHKFNIHPKPGQLVQYLIQNHQTTTDVDRVCIKDLLTKDTSFDLDFYIRYLAQCGETLLHPFDYVKDDLERLFHETICQRVEM